jgi:hypothetical protein
VKHTQKKIVKTCVEIILRVGDLQLARIHTQNPEILWENFYHTILNGGPCVCWHCGKTGPFGPFYTYTNLAFLFIGFELDFQQDSFGPRN